MRNIIKVFFVFFPVLIFFPSIAQADYNSVRLDLCNVSSETLYVQVNDSLGRHRNASFFLLEPNDCKSYDDDNTYGSADVSIRALVLYEHPQTGKLTPIARRLGGSESKYTDGRGYMCYLDSPTEFLRSNLDTRLHEAYEKTSVKCPANYKAKQNNFSFYGSDGDYSASVKKRINLAPPDSSEPVIKDDLLIPKFEDGTNLYEAGELFYSSTDFNIYNWATNRGSFCGGAVAGYRVVIRESRVKDKIIDEKFMRRVYSSLKNSKIYVDECARLKPWMRSIEDFAMFFENNHFEKGEKGVLSTKEVLEKDSNSDKVHLEYPLRCSLNSCSRRFKVGRVYDYFFKLYDDENGPATPFGLEDVLLKRDEALDK